MFFMNMIVCGDERPSLLAPAAPGRGRDRRDARLPHRRRALPRVAALPQRADRPARGGARRAPVRARSAARPRHRAPRGAPSPGAARAGPGRPGDPLSGILRVGVIPTVSPYLLPDIVPALRREHTRLVVLWEEEKTGALLEKLREGRPH